MPLHEVLARGRPGMFPVFCTTRSAVDHPWRLQCQIGSRNYPGDQWDGVRGTYGFGELNDTGRNYSLS